MKDILFVDCGTSYLRIYSSEKGVVCDAPAYLALENNRIVAAGEAAKALAGKVSGYQPASISFIAQPVQKGCLYYDGLLASWLEQIFREERLLSPLKKPNLVFSVSPFINTVEKRAFMNIARSLRISDAYLLPHTYAIFGGYDIDFREGTTRLVIDVGGGKTDIAVLSSGRVITGKSKKGLLEEKHASLVSELKKKYEIDMGERSLSMLERFFSPKEDTDTILLNGKSKITGLPVSITVAKAEAEAYQKEYIDEIIQLVKSVIQPLSPEIISELFESKILISGGGVSHGNLSKAVTDALKLESLTKDNPYHIPLDGFSYLDRMGFGILKSYLEKE
jgi:rod shape-determining protein MreB